MALPQLLSWVNGALQAVLPVQVSLGGGSVGDVVALNSAGLVDASMLSGQIDGGNAAAKFTATQLLDGGNAATVYGTLTYAQTVLQDVPVAYWPLDETSGTVANDLSGNGYNATYEGTPTLGGASIAPGLGNSVQLSGATTEYVTLAAPPAALQLVEGSFEAWVNQSVVKDGAGIFCGGYSTTVNWAIGQGAKNNTKPTTALLFGGNYDAGWDYAGYASTLSAGEIAHVVYTNDGTTARLYLNGVQIYTGASRTFTANANAIFIGGNWNAPGVTLEGLISNCAIYNTVLSATRIQAHYNAGVA